MNKRPKRIRSRGPRAQYNNTRGGENAIPRSLGVTLQAIRYLSDPPLTEGELAYKLADINAPFKDSTSARLMGMLFGKGPPQDPASRYRNYENAKSDWPFSIAFRYGEYSHTLVGIIWLTSHFYAHIRDMTDDPNGENGYEQGLQMADQIEHFAKAARDMIIDMDKRKSEIRPRQINGYVDECMRQYDIEKIIIPLLKAYSDGTND